MFKRYRFWLWAAIVLLFANALIHSFTLFIEPAARNETERQLRELMTSYRIDFGAGFKRNTKELVTALSSSFSLALFACGVNSELSRSPEHASRDESFEGCCRHAPDRVRSLFYHRGSFYFSASNHINGSDLLVSADGLPFYSFF
jgi:hypothetical protein